MESAIAFVKAFTAGQSALGFTGATTCSPLPPDVLTTEVKPFASSLFLTSPAASITRSQVHSPFAIVPLTDGPPFHLGLVWLGARVADRVVAGVVEAVRERWSRGEIEI